MMFVKRFIFKKIQRISARILLSGNSFNLSRYHRMDRNQDSSNFDSYLGGKQLLPNAVNMKEFCEYRMEEILMLTEALKESPFRGQAFQRLPKHMRRRQMSHYIKRLPRRLQNSNFLSLKNDVVSLPKRPSRKYRRRTKNLLLEYNRRQRKNIWLETHIWHSKRFHMISKWGYKLPDKPANKSFRACYRATAQHCFLHDMSYYNTIELRGSEDKLLEGLQQCVSPSCGLTFAAKMYKSGLREGSVMLYHPNTFPYCVIGQISFLWKPVNKEDEIRTLWIFTHPLLHEEIITVFKGLFNFQEEESSEVTASEKNLPENTDCEAKSKSLKKLKKKNEKLKKSEVNENIKLETKNVPFIRTPKYKTSNGSVRMSLLKDTINRFRLIGPLSLAVILEAFDVSLLSSISSKRTEVSVSEDATTNDGEFKRSRSSLKRTHSDSCEVEFIENVKKLRKDEPDDVVEVEATKTKGKEKTIWWCNYYKSEFHKKCLEKQEFFFKELRMLKIPSELPPRMVFSLVVTDPRLIIPSKRTKSSLNNSEETRLISSTDLDLQLCESPLWEPEVRDAVSKLKMTTAEINEARSKFIVPGSDLRKILQEEEQARIPIILIQRDGTLGTDFCDRKDFGSGFDIIVPAGWAMPVWLSLIYRGARTGGLRESKSLILESNNLSDYFQPDSYAGEVENLELFNRSKTAYFKRPPSKRPNYSKMGVRCPFYAPWKILIRDWKNRARNDASSAESENAGATFYVLRDRKKLMELNGLVRNLPKVLKSEKLPRFGHSFRKEEMDCLVQVSLQSLKRGVPKECAMICLPTAEDVEELRNDDFAPVESSHTDKNERVRRLFKMEHAKLLKCLKRRRRKDKLRRSEEMRESTARDSAGDETPAKNLEKSKVPPTKEIVEKYNSEMEQLWLEEPQSVDSVINSCSRTIIGYVVLGGYSYSKGQGLGLGYVTLKGLLHMLERCYDRRANPIILFRNANNSRYNFGKISVCTS